MFWWTMFFFYDCRASALHHLSNMTPDQSNNTATFDVFLGGRREEERRGQWWWGREGVGKIERCGPGQFYQFSLRRKLYLQKITSNGY